MQGARYLGVWTPLMALLSVLVVPACSDGKSGDATARDQVMGGQESGGMMPGMDNMQGMGRGGSMDQMEAHLRMMDGADADSIQALMPTHRQMVTNAIAEIRTAMRGAGAGSDAASSATSDTLRQDLSRMSAMSASGLQQFMPAHRARVRRLMESHRAMMGRM